MSLKGENPSGVCPGRGEEATLPQLKPRHSGGEIAGRTRPYSGEISIARFLAYPSRTKGYCQWHLLSLSA